MKAILKDLGWGELFPETLKRLTYFKEMFRLVYTVDEISDEDLEKEICYDFGTYGQGMIYEIYSKVKNHTKDKNELAETFKAFCKVFEEAIPDTYNKLSIKNMIDLFIEYIYSRVIKNKPLTYGNEE